jgi:hypothetical protein
MSQSLSTYPQRDGAEAPEKPAAPVRRGSDIAVHWADRPDGTAVYMTLGELSTIWKRIMKRRRRKERHSVCPAVVMVEHRTSLAA